MSFPFLSEYGFIPFNIPLPHRPIRDGLDIYRGLYGLPPLKDNKKTPKGFIEGATRGGAFEFIGNVTKNVNKEEPKKKNK